MSDETSEKVEPVLLMVSRVCVYPYRSHSRVSQGVLQSVPEKPELKKSELFV
jgi:hypothetical protein